MLPQMIFGSAWELEYMMIKMGFALRESYPSKNQSRQMVWVGVILHSGKGGAWGGAIFWAATLGIANRHEGCELTFIKSFCVAWGKFNELLPIIRF